MGYGLKSDIGQIRKINQDTCLAKNFKYNNQSIHVFAVADGLGGHSAGEVASQYIIKYIEDNIVDIFENINENNLNVFIDKMNESMREFSLKNTEWLDMATTVTLALAVDSHLIIGHAGDSRAYIINTEKKELKSVTKDHSYVQILLEEGKITEKEAKSHPQKNVITSAIGIRSQIEISVNTYDLKSNEIVMLCSDGLYNLLSEEEIINIVVNNSDVQIACNKLVKRANINGGYDNITVVLFDNMEETE